MDKIRTTQGDLIVRDARFTIVASRFNDFIVDYGLNESDNWRADMINSLTVAMSKTLALKVGLTWIYQNEPAFTQVTLVGPGVPDGTTVPVQVDELDTIFTTSLVVSF